MPTPKKTTTTTTAKTRTTAKKTPAPVEVPPIPDEDEDDFAVGDLVRYTDTTGAERAAIVIFSLSSDEETRPVLRVMVPMAPPLTEMPDEGVPYVAGMRDMEVYGPRFDPNPKAKNTWRPLE